MGMSGAPLNPALAEKKAETTVQKSCEQMATGAGATLPVTPQRKQIQMPVEGPRLDLFEYNAPSANQLEALKLLRQSCDAHYKLLITLLPPGRCRSLAITKLEEVSMWENKACVFEVEDTTPKAEEPPVGTGKH